MKRFTLPRSDPRRAARLPVREDRETVIYAFGECELDEARRALARRGREVRLQPKVLDLLLFLLRHRERVVPKEVLFRELWPDVIVTEASLTRLVKEARRAVGDDGRRQRVPANCRRGRPSTRRLAAARG